MDIEEKHKLDLKALESIKQVCEDLNINYFLLAGSALGAVRHKGFIPWDDDIDIGIRYHDIPKFEKAIGEWLPKEFEYINFTNNVHYPRLHGKILYQGENCVDIFPIVKTSDRKLEQRIQWSIRKITWKLYSRKVGYVHPKEGKALVVISNILSHLISRNMILKLTDVNCKMFEKKKSDYYINLFSTYSMEKELIYAECIENIQDIFFENGEYKTVGNLDKYLTHLYGDYMKLPPEEERIALHEEKFIYD
jgi:lipopolysaccharide cholinephosphotransferase